MTLILAKIIYSRKWVTKFNQNHFFERGMRKSIQYNINLGDNLTIEVYGNLDNRILFFRIIYIHGYMINIITL